MKNVIFILGLIFLNVNVQAQNIIVKLDTIYSFKHDKSIETQKAFDSGVVRDFGFSFKNLKLDFDEVNKIITTFENGVIVEISDIKEISYLNGQKQYYTEKGGFVFYKNKNGEDCLAGAYFDPKTPNVVNGFYAKIKKGDE